MNVYAVRQRVEQKPTVEVTMEAFGSGHPLFLMLMTDSSSQIYIQG